MTWECTAIASNALIGPTDSQLFSCTDLTFKPLGPFVKAHRGERFMENPKAATIRQVQQTFAAWKAVNDQINTVESALQHAAAPGNASASGLEMQLQALRLESERLLMIAQQALLTIKTPRSSNGDTNWG